MPKAKAARKGFAGVKKQSKPISVPDRIKHKYQRLQQQTTLGHYANAAKTANQILLLKPDDPLAAKTKAQCLILQDQFRQVLETDGSHLAFERAYALYKLGQEAEALQVLETTSSDDRGAQVLRAQIVRRALAQPFQKSTTYPQKYKLQDYHGSKQIYKELLLTSDLDSPEHADLENNLAACDAYLDFATSVPSKLSSLQSENLLPPFLVLEQAPIGPLVASAFKSKPKPLSQTTAPLKKARKAKEPKLPAPIASLAPEERPPIDPERWLPKRERAAFKEEQAAKQRQADARERQKEKLTVQGSSSASAAHAGPDKAGGKVSTSGGGGGQKKKKKGGKK